MYKNTLLDVLLYNSLSISTWILKIENLSCHGILCEEILLGRCNVVQLHSIDPVQETLLKRRNL